MTMDSPRIVVASIILVLMPAMAFALDRLPEEKGWAGFVNLGVGAAGLKSNMIVGNDLADLGQDTIGSILAGPDRDTTGLPIINAEIGYYFDSTKTYLFAGNNLEDLIRYDFTTVAGVRQGFRGETVMSVEFLFSGIPAIVWQDPYVAGVKRAETDRESPGARLTFDRVAGSGLEIVVAMRDISLDNERSGQALGLTQAQRDLLNREGDQRQVEVSYRFKFSKKHYLTPTLIFADFDLDGEAMANDQRRLRLTYGYLGERFLLVSNVFVGTGEYDAINPIYGVERDDDQLGLTVTGFFKNLFGSERWTGVVSAAGIESNSNIDFYDTRAGLLSVSALMRF
jgi:hypothetical protein